MSKSTISRYPSKFINMSSSVILIRPHQGKKSVNIASSAPPLISLANLKNNKLDYQVLLLKRNAKLSFANYFAFPGGMIEKQDYVHKWHN